MPPLMSIVLPTYNEKENVRAVLDEICAFHSRCLADQVDLEVLTGTRA